MKRALLMQFPDNKVPFKAHRQLKNISPHSTDIGEGCIFLVAEFIVTFYNDGMLRAYDRTPFH